MNLICLAYIDKRDDINDQGQLSNMVSKAREILPDEKVTVLADTGYYNMAQIVKSSNENTEILIKEQKRKKEKLKNSFDKFHFTYNHTKDNCTCPLGYNLEFKWNGKKKGKNHKRYTCKDFDICGKKDLCTLAKAGRSVTRFEDEEMIERVAQNTIQKENEYKMRGSMVEHPFGTIKRQFGYTYFLTRGLESINTEASLICLAYNFKRLINIVQVRKLLGLIKDKTLLLFSKICHFQQYSSLFHKIYGNRSYC